VPRAYSYPATFERDEDGRYVVRFPDLPEALTDGASEEEALAEAADCLSEALASRIVDGEEIPSPSSPRGGEYLISPDPTIALKAALHTALAGHAMTIADLAHLLRIKDWHQAARLIDPKRPSKLRRLAAALDALGCTIEIVIRDGVSHQQASEGSAPLPVQAPKPEIVDCFITAALPPFRQRKFEAPQLASERGGLARAASLPAFSRCGSPSRIPQPASERCGLPGAVLLPAFSRVVHRRGRGSRGAGDG
jgi:antitoxin HicB